MRHRISIPVVSCARTVCANERNIEAPTQFEKRKTEQKAIVRSQSAEWFLNLRHRYSHKIVVFHLRQFFATFHSVYARVERTHKLFDIKCIMASRHAFCWRVAMDGNPRASYAEYAFNVSYAPISRERARWIVAQLNHCLCAKSVKQIMVWPYLVAVDIAIWIDSKT